MHEPLNGLVFGKTVASIIGTLTASAIIAIVVFTFSTRKDLEQIRLAQANSVSEVRLLAQQITYMSDEFRDLEQRVRALEVRTGTVGVR